MITKQNLRKQANQNLNQINDFNFKSRLIIEKLINQEEYKNAKTVLVYQSFKNEVETFDFIKKSQSDSKEVKVPRINFDTKTMDFFSYNKENMQKNKIGILEPNFIKNENIFYNNDAIIIVPCLGFTKNCERLGRGGGYYDKFLAKYPLYSICLAFECQKFDFLPTETFDIKMNKIITEENIYY